MEKSKLPLFPYQQKDVDLLYQIGSGLLGNEPGTGKTLTTIALAEKIEARKILVFCPSVLKYQWAKEIAKFTPHRKAIVIEGAKSERDGLWVKDCDYYIANYELLLRDFDTIQASRPWWDLLLSDEATKISNPKAKCTRLIMQLKANRRVAMTGTPISNTPQNLWSVMTFCRPGYLGNYWRFISRYCIKNEWNAIVAYQNLEELRVKISRYMIRRTKQEVLPELPDKIETDVTFVLSKEEQALQKKIKKELLAEIEKNDIDKVEKPQNIQFTLTKMIRLRQLADSMELLGSNEKSSKMEVLAELLEENQEHKIIIFSEFSEMCKIIKRKYPQSVMIIGETKDEERQKVLKEFNENPEKKLCILSSAGQFGLNIQVSDTIINYDLPFSLAKFEQRIGRAHRIGQKNTVMVYNLLGVGTLDFAVKKILYKKADLSSQLLGKEPISIKEVKDLLTYEPE